MAIQDSLNAARIKLEETMKDRRFRRANLTREEQIALDTAQAMCRGKLEVCQRDFSMIVREQSKNIREGQSIGADTQLQEQMLWDAAIGYMLVRDAIYSLKTIRTHNSLSHAYEMMDLASRHVSGKKSGLPLKTIRNRNIFGYVTSSAAYNEKSNLLDTFFEDLKECGDIQKCLDDVQNARRQEASPRNTYTQERPQQHSDNSSSAAEDENDSMNRLRNLKPRSSEQIQFTFKENPLTKGIDYGSEK